jgi:GT2 family glycosyltransferase
LFLDNDVEAIDPGWLEHMLGYGLRTDVGVVGAILLSENELVQHGGVIVGLNGSADHADRNSPFRISTSVRNHGHNGSLLASRDVSAVTAACMLTRADVFHSLNGFDQDLVVEFNDVDYCLRASTLGYKIIKDAYAVLYRLENRSRPGEAGDPHSEDRRLFRDRYRELLIKGDPFHSPMLSRFTTEICWNGMAVPERKPRARTTRVILPAPIDGGRITRFDTRVSGDLNLRPHVGSHASLTGRQLTS